MEVSAVTAPGGALLASVRGLLGSSDDALLCVAFAQARGVHLIARELESSARRGRARVLVTTTLGATSEAAMTALRDGGASIRVLNPGGSTYHPKVYLGRRDGRTTAIIGSANLTSGLVANVEAATVLHGRDDEPPLSEL
ncbi:phospholipase D family protein [Sandaracinus amylolyticus]|uniref:Uncharacterized protein n=1 Tax=Sandaracinus amylolyticus TaxID=927083 RepID=A0A0F6YMQ5_9BACT|nr:phospholipase D family protein [Sandaracinus amylolyticus]AKF11626.1 hypothetical protein DB32_008775 [Sandaracinus amylolyticus]